MTIDLPDFTKEIMTMSDVTNIIHDLSGLVHLVHIPVHMIDTITINYVECSRRVGLLWNHNNHDCLYFVAIFSQAAFYEHPK